MVQLAEGQGQIAQLEQVWDSGSVDSRNRQTCFGLIHTPRPQRSQNLSVGDRVRPQEQTTCPKSLPQRWQNLVGRVIQYPQLLHEA
jgi:hypothetical protein